MREKTIAILGATGSVGTQAADVARKKGIRVSLLSAFSDTDGAERLAREFMPDAVAMADIGAAERLRIALADTDIKVYGGDCGLTDAIYDIDADVYVNAVLGCAGLLPSVAVLEKGRRLALANKETMVVAGEAVTRKCVESGGEIIPVDSEHCAIFQCMSAGRLSEVRSIILTASGGPFYGYTSEMLGKVTLRDALAHPTWKMGNKITVDSATLMNKGFEVIEAVRLFGVGPENVRVVVHRESIIHSAVEYIDNTVIAEMSVPDMRSCVQYAVDYPDRSAAVTERLDLFSVGTLTFAPPDPEVFPLLGAAFDAVSCGGGVPAVLNAADEVAVDAFLKEKIRFCDISEAVMGTVSRLRGASEINDIDDILSLDSDARRVARELVSDISGRRNV